MSVSWLPGLAGSAAFLAGVVASFCLILLPAALLLRGEPGREVDEFKRAHPRRAWLVDWFLPATAVTMLGLWMIPVKFYVDPALGGVDPATRWIVPSALSRLPFFPPLLRGGPGREVDESKRAHPRRAWLVDWFLPATAVTMLGLWMIPVKFYVDPALGGVDPATRWIVTSAVFGFTFFQWLFLPMSGLELATGMTLAPRGNAPQGWPVIGSPRVRGGGLVRL